MSTASAIAALFPPLPVREVLAVATRLADLMDTNGVTYSNIEASGDTVTELVNVHTNWASSAEGPAAIAAELGLIVNSIDYGPATTRYALVHTEFEGVKVWLFGDDLNELAPDNDPRPIAPLFPARDVTGWTPEEIVDDQEWADEIVQTYQDDLAAWLTRHPEAADDVPECGGVDEDDQGKRVCHLPAGHAAESSHQFTPVQA